MCDDDNVTPVTSEDVLKLSGGGDWHIAYILVYGPRLLEIPENQKSMSVSASKDVSEAMSTDN